MAEEILGETSIIGLHYLLLRRTTLIYLACILLGATTARAADSGPIVAVDGGRVQGAFLSAGGAVFKGIPYAQPPVGALRWREPLPVKAWPGVRAATSFGPACAQTPQLLPDIAKTSKEDCLYLNVWTPDWPSKSGKPVMVWIPGGGNFAGAASRPIHDSDSLARHGVVLVTLNYRLGVFGFFSHPLLTRESSHHASGNQGILDQIAALKWVRDNISKFGGNPRNVTIFGESAGSLDVSVLMTSPLSKGLFRRVIGESGAVVLLGDPLTLAQAEHRGEAQAARWKLPVDPSLQDLRAVSAVDILNAEPNYLQAPAPNGGITVDGHVFPQAPAKVFASAQEHRVALLLGNNSLERVPGSLLPTELKQAIEESYGPLAGRAWSLYAAATNDPDYGTPTQQWGTDTSFRCAAVEQLLWHAAAGNPTYEYEFARVPSGREAVGAAHASDLPYVFGTLDKGVPYPLLPPVPSTVISDIDWRVSKVMQQYWTNFAKTGNPNGAGLPEWPMFDASSRAYIQFTAAGPVTKAALRRPYCDVFIDNVERLMSTGGK
ncbi:MAG: carboxylesterase family protein [Steroidobacteraceae bacterium]|jgi:para-nitrobenzyl esterase